MAFDVFTNAEAVAVRPDAILGPDGLIITDYPLSPDAQASARFQAPGTAGLSEVPLPPLFGNPVYGVPVSSPGVLPGIRFQGKTYGLHDPLTGGLILPSDNISATNAEILARMFARGNPVSSETLKNYGVTGGTIAQANAKIPAYRAEFINQMIKDNSMTLLDKVLLGLKLAEGAVIAYFAPPAGAALFAASTSSVSLAQANAAQGHLTVEQVAGAALPVVAGSTAAYFTPVAGAVPTAEQAITATQARYASIFTPVGTTVQQTENLVSGALANTPGLAESTMGFAPIPSSMVGASLGVQTSALFPAVSSGASVLSVKTAVQAAQQAPAAKTIVNDLLAGKVGSAFSDLGRAFGLPIPKFPGSPALLPVPAIQPVAGGALPGGGAVDFGPASPYDTNTTQWIIGAGLVLLVVVLFLRKG